ncbi:sugar transferase [bacterium DOLZORAL124_64_63]|nr:MAG: sugar transferase [bacterium DOLZORAL124_64_63]
MLKRSLDLVGAFLGLVLLAPLFTAVAIGVKLSSSGPVFFRQERVGKNGVPFWIYKFRTMTHNPRGKGALVTSQTDNRVTPLGGFLRRKKLDELPQLFNVLLGQMSLVGPRPEVPRYVQYFPDHFAKVNRQKPGMTHRVSLLLRHEEKILAASSDPEAMYVKEVLPWKLGLYLENDTPDSLADDIITICRTIIPQGQDELTQDPFVDSPLVAHETAGGPATQEVAAAAS